MNSTFILYVAFPVIVMLLAIGVTFLSGREVAVKPGRHAHSAGGLHDDNARSPFFAYSGFPASAVAAAFAAIAIFAVSHFAPVDKSPSVATNLQDGSFMYGPPYSAYAPELEEALPAADAETLKRLVRERYRVLFAPLPGDSTETAERGPNPLHLPQQGAN